MSRRRVSKIPNLEEGGANKILEEQEFNDEDNDEEVMNSDDKVIDHVKNTSTRKGTLNENEIKSNKGFDDDHTSMHLNQNNHSPKPVNPKKKTSKKWVNRYGNAYIRGAKDEESRKAVIKLHEQHPEMSKSAISRQVGVARRTVHRWLHDRELEIQGRLFREERRGRKWKLTEDNRKWIQTFVTENPGLPFSELHLKVEKNLNIHLHPSTLHRWLHRLGVQRLRKEYGTESALGNMTKESGNAFSYNPNKLLKTSHSINDQLQKQYSHIDDDDREIKGIPNNKISAENLAHTFLDHDDDDDEDDEVDNNNNNNNNDENDLDDIPVQEKRSYSSNDGYNSEIASAVAAAAAAAAAANDDSDLIHDSVTRTQTVSLDSPKKKEVSKKQENKDIGTVGKKRKYSSSNPPSVRDTNIGSKGSKKGT